MGRRLRGQAPGTSREAGEVERGSSGTRGERGRGKPDIGHKWSALGGWQLILESRGKTPE